MTILIEGNNGYNVIDPIEEEALRITKPQTDKLWEKVRETLKKAKHLKLNITREWKMVNKIPWSDAEISRQRECNIFNRKEKLANLVGDGSYSKVEKYPILKTNKSQTLNKKKDYFTWNEYTQHYSKLPQMYSLPKIHKNAIVSCWGSACHLLSRFHIGIINLLTGKSLSYVKNSTHFVETIKETSIYKNWMVRLDIVSLFTKVPTDEVLLVV